MSVVSRTDFMAPSSMAGRRIDYVLQYCENTKRSENGVSSPGEFRAAFEKLLQKNGFDVVKVTVQEYSFIMLCCTEDRLQSQAEKMLLKMPLKESYTDYTQCGLAAWLCNAKSSCSARLTGDSEKGLIHDSSSFSCARAGIFKKYDEDESTLFGPATRNYLVHNILSEIDVTALMHEQTQNVTQRKKDEILAKKGLTFLLSKHIYQRAYPLAGDYIMPSTSFATNEDESQSEKPKADLRTMINCDEFHMPSFIGVFGFNFVSRLRERFGEEVAFYYAWMSVMMQLLIVLSGAGLILFILGIFIQLPGTAENDLQNETGATTYNDSRKVSLTLTASPSTSPFIDPASEAIAIIGNLYDQFLAFLRGRIDNLFTWIFGILLCLWGTFVGEAWKRQCAVIAHMWGVEGCNVSEAVRPQFTGVVKTDPYAEGRLIAEHPSAGYWAKRITALIIIIIAGAISLVLTILCTDLRLYVGIEYCSDNASSKAKCWSLIVASVVLNVILTMISNMIVSKIALVLTHWENHLTETEHSSALAIKLLALSAMNGYIPMYYIAFFQGSKDIFLSWSIVGHIAGWKENRDSSCGRYSTCTPILAVQLIAATLLKPLLKILIRTIFRSIKWQCKWPLCKVSLRKCSRTRNVHNTCTSLEKVLHQEVERQPSDYWVIEQYQEKILSFGYIMLFSASMPLVPLFVLIVHAIEHWLETRNLLQSKQRPVVVLVQNIGIWKGVLELINIVGVVTTGFLMSSMIENPIKATEIGRLHCSLLIMIAMVILKGAFAGLIPDTPRFVIAAQRKEKYIAQKELCSCSSTSIKLSAGPTNAAGTPIDKAAAIDDDGSSQCFLRLTEVAHEGSSLYPNLEYYKDH